MRRRDKEITHSAVLESIIRRSRVCRLALAKDNQPYVVPLCFGYEDRTIYVHGAREGMKLDVLRSNNMVCVEFDIDVELIPGQASCDWGMRYRSVIGFGRALVVDDLEAKRKACDVIMRQYSDQPQPYLDEALEKVAVIRIEIDRMTGKQSGY